MCFIVQRGSRWDTFNHTSGEHMDNISSSSSVHWELPSALATVEKIGEEDGMGRMNTGAEEWAK